MRSRRAGSNSVSFFAFQDIITSVVGIFVLITLIMILELVQSKVNAATQRVSVPMELVAQLQELEADVQRLEALHKKLQASAAKAASRNAFSAAEERESLARKLEEAESELETARRRTARMQTQLQATKNMEKELVRREAELAKLQESSSTSASERQDTARVSAALEIDKPLIFRDQTQQGRYLVLVILQQGQIHVTDAQTHQTHKLVNGALTGSFNEWLSHVDIHTRQFLLIVKPSGEKIFEDVRDLLKKASAVYGFDVAGEDQNFRLRFELGGA